ncbi:tripartite tricarboxylate transporter TctB family protein [Azospirillum halopraeferens]|uniref:tripartite tricarboxylate transporter TctB family protein n=1 Tax=Azospirillum halopraeferens TaxID=34010 RepID=UPI00048B6837|nr:tripartite tricarboxylate transporter TctB family protein [Azospirillum halopraeferens]
MTSEPMDIRRQDTVPCYARINVIGGAVMVFIAGLVWCGAITLDLGTIADFGAGAMPAALSIILAAAGGVVLILGFIQRDEEAERVEFAVAPVAILAIAIAMFGFFVRGGDFGLVSTPQLGLMVVGPLTVFIAGCATPEMRVRELLPMSFGLTAMVLLVFCDILSVTIPVFPKLIQDTVSSSFGLDVAMRGVYLAYGALAATLHVALPGVGGNRRD